MPNITFRVTGGTNVGLVRKNNEDNFIVNPDLTQSEWFLPADTSLSIEGSEYGILMVVADGMGGMNAGEVASAIAIDTVKGEFSTCDLKSITVSDSAIENFMRGVIIKADSNIKEHVQKEPETEGMGTTIVMAWVVGGAAHIAWCGDSRAYLFNKKVGLSRLSKDHSYVQQLVDDGKLEEDLAFDHPNSNIITRSLGDISQKAKPDYVLRCLSSDDMIILCSDGLCGLCRDNEILELLNDCCEKQCSLEQFKSSLIGAALDAGGYDNVTLTILQADKVDDQHLIKEADNQDHATLNDFGQSRKRKMRIKITLCVLALIAILLCVGLFATKRDGSDVSRWSTFKDKIENIFKRDSLATEQPNEVNVETDTEKQVEQNAQPQQIEQLQEGVSAPSTETRSGVKEKNSTIKPTTKPSNPSGDKVKDTKTKNRSK